jgi:hypothetical protein
MSCAAHRTQVPAADVRPFDDRRTRLRIDGIARTGQTSPKGTVEHVDYYSGRVAATAKPSSVNVVLKELPWFRDRFVYRDNQWIEKTTGKPIAWTQKPLQDEGSNRSKQNGAKPRETAPSRQTFVPSLRTLGVGIGRGGVPLTPTAPNPASSKRASRSQAPDKE